MTSDDEFAAVLRRLRAGDQKALEPLLAKLRPYLHLLVRQHLPPERRHQLGDSDIVQESLVRIHGGLDPGGSAGGFQGQQPPEFLAWVGQIVRHVIVDMERRGLTQKRDERREMPGFNILATLAKGSTPGQGAERAERAIFLAAALGRLPQHQREVLQGRVFEQLSFAQISARTGKSEGALRVVATRALEALRADQELRRLLEAST